MKKNVLSTLILLFFIFGMTSIGHALDLDETVDDEIRKNYNPSKLIDDITIQETALDKTIKFDNQPQIVDENLPALPNIIKHGDSTKNSDVVNNTIKTPVTRIYSGGNTKIKKGTSFDVRSNLAISDWQTRGTKVKFATKSNTYGKGYTIPAGTIFQGEIVESHRPQITCNGGLVVIKISSMIYKDQIIPLNAYITRANDKKIFLNNIKGNRTFLKTMWKKGNWGRTLFNKMMTLTINLGADGSTCILSPFPLAYGTICLGANALTSPITAFFSKGGSLSIPMGSNFRIKLLEDVMID